MLWKTVNMSLNVKISNVFNKSWESKPASRAQRASFRDAFHSSMKSNLFTILQRNIWLHIMLIREMPLRCFGARFTFEPLEMTSNAFKVWLLKNIYFWPNFKNRTFYRRIVCHVFKKGYMCNQNFGAERHFCLMKEEGSHSPSTTPFRL